MELSDDLLCLFTARVEERDGSYVIEIPEREVRQGDVTGGEVYRIAVLPRSGGSEASTATPERSPPVAEGDVREVTIEDLGAQGDGIARVERGFVIIVPDAEPGDEVTVEITNVAENYAIGEVVEGNGPDGGPL